MTKWTPQSNSWPFDAAILHSLQSRYADLLYAGNIATDTGLFETLRKVLGKIGKDAGRQACLEAALWLLAGDWDQAHRLCQDVATIHGSAWHGVVHRLEGEYWNSRYWWRRAGGLRWDALAGEYRGIVGTAPAAVAHELGSLVQKYDPAVFVDLVERHCADAVWKPWLLDLQRWEWAALFLETA